MYLMIAFYSGNHAASSSHHATRQYFFRDGHQGTDMCTPLRNVRSLFDAETARRLCDDDDDTFNANLRITQTEHMYRANGKWHPLSGAHFQGNCKAYLVRLLGGPVLDVEGRRAGERKRRGL